jgi:hypothetical protein
MSILASVQTQIDVLRGTNDFEKKKVMDTKNIKDVRGFIAEKKGTKGWEAHEASFKEWEELVAKYESEK